MKYAGVFDRVVRVGYSIAARGGGTGWSGLSAMDVEAAYWVSASFDTPHNKVSFERSAGQSD
jgi:predicted butyrate kinase (DUF1464 family)